MELVLHFMQFPFMLAKGMITADHFWLMTLQRLPSIIILTLYYSREDFRPVLRITIKIWVIILVVISLNSEYIPDQYINELRNNLSVMIRSLIY